MSGLRCRLPATTVSLGLRCFLFRARSRARMCRVVGVCRYRWHLGIRDESLEVDPTTTQSRNMPRVSLDAGLSRVVLRRGQRDDARVGVGQLFDGLREGGDRVLVRVAQVDGQRVVGVHEADESVDLPPARCACRDSLTVVLSMRSLSRGRLWSPLFGDGSWCFGTLPHGQHSTYEPSRWYHTIRDRVSFSEFQLTASDTERIRVPK